MARSGAIGSAARLLRPITWWPCHPPTGQRPSSCWGSMHERVSAGSQRRRRDQVPSTTDDPTGAPRALQALARARIPAGWDETAVAGTVAYREADLERLLGPDGDAIVLIYVGRFTSAKRVPLLVRAFARARPRFLRPTSLVVWGGHPGEWEGEHPVTVARQVGSDGVFFAGWRGHDDLPDALAACDALVMASVNDSYPQAPLEAMAVGLPVIATNSGGFPLMINLDHTRPTGWLVPPDDEAALAEALVDAANRPQEIRRRGDAALAHARTHLSWSSRVEQVRRDLRPRHRSPGETHIQTTHRTTPLTAQRRQLCRVRRLAGRVTDPSICRGRSTGESSDRSRSRAAGTTLVGLPGRRASALADGANRTSRFDLRTSGTDAATACPAAAGRSDAPFRTMAASS